MVAIDDAKTSIWQFATVTLARVSAVLVIALAAGLFLRGQGLTNWIDVNVLAGSRDQLSGRSRSTFTLLVHQPAAPAGPPSCNLPVEDSVLSRTCKLLTDVCLDQGGLILYGPQYRPQNGNGAPINLPVLKTSSSHTAFYLPYWKRDNADVEWGLPPVPVRPASDREARKYLAEPSFSTCTVPVIFFQHNQFNFAHTFRDNAALAFSVLRETPWAPHMKFILQTGAGIGISTMNMALWQPISNLSVDSLADASVRLADQQIGRPRLGRTLPSSYEGTEQRCFKNLFVCTGPVAPDTWQLHAYGQLIVQHYGGDALVKSQSAAWPPGQAGRVLPPPVSVLGQLGRPAALVAGSGAVGKAGEESGEEVELRIVFQRRGGEGLQGMERQLVNVAELLQRCNQWRFTAPSGERVRALCWQVQIDSLEAGIAAAQLADITVGAHGANIANGWLQRPGSSVLELTMHQFEETHTGSHVHLAKRNFADVASQVAFYKLLLCDPKGSWTPGPREERALKNGGPPDPKAPKHRNLVVRWDTMQTVLEDIVSVGGDMAEYRQRFTDGRWWWFVGTKDLKYAGPRISTTCSQAREQGLQ